MKDCYSSCVLVPPLPKIPLPLTVGSSSEVSTQATFEILRLQLLVDSVVAYHGPARRLLPSILGSIARIVLSFR
ncbi:hypothetical protein CLV76_13116 [Marivita geojedonensis]|nr:hypothetical protein CLV76_13116 [Marivita geojedonensis]